MKKKILVLALALAVMLTGAGYAYWTDQLTIESTITTGEFDVNFVSASAGGGDRNPGAATTNWNKYIHPSIDKEDKSVTARLANFYPGSVAHLTLVVENNGTIPAVFDYADVKFVDKSSNKILKRMYYRIDYKVVDENGATVDTKHYVDDTGLGTFEEKMNALLKGVTLEPGQTIYIGEISDTLEEEGEDLDNKYTFELPKTVTDCEDEEFTIKIQMNWKQHNAPFTADQVN